MMPPSFHIHEDHDADDALAAACDIITADLKHVQEGCISGSGPPMATGHVATAKQLQLQATTEWSTGPSATTAANFTASFPSINGASAEALSAPGCTEQQQHLSDMSYIMHAHAACEWTVPGLGTNPGVTGAFSLMAPGAVPTSCGEAMLQHQHSSCSLSTQFVPAPVSSPPAAAAALADLSYGSMQGFQARSAAAGPKCANHDRWYNHSAPGALQNQELQQQAPQDQHSGSLLPLQGTYVQDPAADKAASNKGQRSSSSIQSRQVLKATAPDALKKQRQAAKGSAGVKACTSPAAAAASRAATRMSGRAAAELIKSLQKEVDDLTSHKAQLRDQVQALLTAQSELLSQVTEVTQKWQQAVAENAALHHENLRLLQQYSTT